MVMGRAVIVLIYGNYCNTVITEITAYFVF